MADGRAVLVHGADAQWRRSLRDALTARWSATMAAHGVHGAVNGGELTVLLSSREAEAAKWWADPRLALVIAPDSAVYRRALASLGVSLGVSLPVHWVPADHTNGVTAVASSVDDVARDAIRRLRDATRRP
jgi:hypothetical protein